VGEGAHRPEGGDGDGATTEIPRRDGERFYSPLVRRIAGEQGVTLAELRAIDGTGQSGRVTKADLLGYIKAGRKGASAPAAAPAKAAPAGAAPSKPAAAPAQRPGLGEKKTLEELGLDPNRVTVQKLNFMRKKIAQHMRDSLDTSAHVFSVHEIDMTTCWEIREAVKQDFKEQFGTSLTFTSFIVWAAARALRQFPWVNARLNGDEVIFHDYVNIGVAVALPENGLVVPKIRNAEDLTIAGIQRKMNDLATRARDNKLSPDELGGGTFTITNMGSGGTLIGLPIISQPEVAIMGVGAIQQRPVIKNGGIIPRHMMYVSLSYDHRLVDGMLAANFLSAVTAELEGLNPMLIGLDRRKG
jgi:pyruvate/2-oxoglutarate dehydrogenase complex dihydrolipoamide acyltransferase (E2) component